MVSSGSVNAEVEFTLSEHVVLINRISPWSSHTLSEWFVTFRGLDFRILFLLSVFVSAAAPTVVLKGEVSILSASISASVLVETVFLWTEFEVSSGIISVAADGSPSWLSSFSLIDSSHLVLVIWMFVVCENSISPWSSHILTEDITLLIIDLLVLFLSIRVTAAAPTVVLKGEVLESRAFRSASGVGISVFLWTEFEVSSGIIFVTSDVSVRWNILCGGSSLGNSVCVELLDDLAVPHGEASFAEVNWGSETELLLLSGWNHDTIIVTDVS